LHVHVQRKDCITMNDVASTREIRNTAMGLRMRLFSEMNDMLMVLDKNIIPSIDECDRLQNVIREYVSYLKQKEAEKTVSEPPKISATDISISFNDISSEGVNSNSIIADLLDKPELITILYLIGLRKIVEENELPISNEQRERLFGGGYLATLNIKMHAVNKEYLALTSKGWLCFQRRVIAQQLRKSQGVDSLFLPVWLAESQIRWKSDTYQRAILLRNYYKRITEVRDFTIFSFPENTQLLFGCSASPTPEVVYACAITEKSPLAEEELITLNRIVTSESVSRLYLISESEQYGKTIMGFLNIKPQHANKVELVMEDDYG